jgi:hypothetical protein
MRRREYDAVLTKEILTDLYVDRGWTLDDLQAHFGINRTTVADYLKHHGIPAKKRGSWSRTHTYDEHFFERIDTFDKAYILGLLVSDSCLHGQFLSIALQERDGDLLRNIAILMGDATILRRREPSGKGLGQITQAQIVFAISNKQIANDLERAGLMQSPKSGKERFISFPDDRLTWCFVRGVFDGDGTVGQYQNSFVQRGRTYGPYTVYQFAIMCGLDLLQGLSDFLYSQGIIVPPKGIIAKDNTGWLRLQQKDTLYLIREYLYRDGSLWLERKKQVFNSI